MSSFLSPMCVVLLYAAFFLTVDAATTIKAPTSFGQCQVVHLDVTGDPPLHVQVVSSSLPSLILSDLGSSTKTTNSISWVADIAADTPVQFLVTDKGGIQTFSQPVVVQSTNDRSCFLSSPLPSSTTSSSGPKNLAKVQSSSASTSSTGTNTFLGSVPTASVVLSSNLIGKKTSPGVIVILVLVVLGLLIGLVFAFIWIRRMYQKPRIVRERVPIDDDYEIVEPSRPLGMSSWNSESVAPSMYEGTEGDEHPESGSANDVADEEQGLVAKDSQASPDSRRPSLSRPAEPRVPRAASQRSNGGYSPISLYNSWRSDAATRPSP